MKVTRKKLRLNSNTVFGLVNAVIMVVLLLLFAYPLYYTIIASFSDPEAVVVGKLSIKPVGFSIEAYKAVFANRQIWIGYRNTIIYTVFGTLFNLFLTIPLGYALSKKHLFCRKFFTWFFMFTMYFGGGMIPTYLLYKQLNLINNPVIMILCSGLSVYNTIVTRTYFQNSIPDSLYEAARIDGGSEFQSFFRIALPLAKPIIAVMILYYAVEHWNSYFNALLYLPKVVYQPLALVLRRILILNQSAFEDALANGVIEDVALKNAIHREYLAETMKYALVFIASAPMLIIYPFIQKYFVKGVMIGAVKE